MNETTVVNIASVCFVLAVLSTYFPLKKAQLGVKGGLGIGELICYGSYSVSFLLFAWSDYASFNMTPTPTDVAAICLILALVSSYYPLKRAYLGIKGGSRIGEIVCYGFYFVSLSIVGWSQFYS